MADLFTSTISPWSSGKGEQADVVLCSRIRLARNFAPYPFPLKATEESSQKVLDIMKDFCQKHESYRFLSLGELSPLQKRVLVEKHLISPEHAQGDGKFKGVVLDDEATVSIMVNEEDHLRLQCFAPGMDLMGLWDKADKLDDLIEADNEYAFDEQYGYLTCCPTNLGNGLRGSVMMHLPALSLSGQLGVLNQLGNIGMTVRGLYGEGSEAIGDLYQISNQLTLGQSENDILTNLYGVNQQLIREERNARDYLLEHNRVQLEDRCWRALGTLTHARYLSSREALSLISLVRLGVAVGIIGHLTLETVSNLYMLVQPGYLQLIAKNNDINETERDLLRAKQVKEYLA